MVEVEEEELLAVVDAREHDHSSDHDVQAEHDED